MRNFLCAAVVAIMLSGCAAEQRFLSAEQDAEMAKACADGCVVIPEAEFRALVQSLRKGAGVEI